MEKFDWTRSAVLILIKKWEEHDCLYNRSHENYNSKQARYEALSIIAEEMSQDFPRVTISDVKNKINYIRGQYSRELAKKRKKINGQAYVSSAFWFNKLGFLNAYIQSRASEGNNQNVTQDSLNFSRDPSDPLETEVTTVKKIKVLENSLSSYEHDDSLNDAKNLFNMCEPAKPEIMLQNESITESPYSSNDTSSMDATNAFNMYVPTNTKTILQSDSFAEFLKVEFAKIKNQVIYDEMMENIMHCVFDAKKKQRETNGHCDLQVNSC